MLHLSQLSLLLILIPSFTCFVFGHFAVYQTISFSLNNGPTSLSLLSVSVSRLAAHALIRQWEEDSDNPQEHSKECLDLSLEAGVLSSQVALVLTEEKTETEAQKEGEQGDTASHRPHRVDVPVSMPR